MEPENLETVPAQVPSSGADPISNEGVGSDEAWAEQLRTLHVEAGRGALERLPELVKAHGSKRVLVVTDHGIQKAGHVERALRLLRSGHEHVVTEVFADVEENPTEANVAEGAACAEKFLPDLIVGIGGGSPMDCAKGINFVHSNGGRMRDYAGFGKATRPMLPSIGVPCSTGTGSEAQSFALISRDDDHVKMACGDKGARFRAVILDSDLAATQPADVFALTALDAASHAVETYVTRTRNAASQRFAKAAWDLLAPRIEERIAASSNAAAIDSAGMSPVEPGCNSSAFWLDMLKGAHLAGAAIEASMLGAAHALANPISAVCDLEHGAAVAIVLPAVVRWNAKSPDVDYSGLAGGGLSGEQAGEVVASKIERWRDHFGVPGSLHAIEIAEAQITTLAEMAEQQWTGKHNPRELTASDAAALYMAVLDGRAFQAATVAL